MAQPKWDEDDLYFSALLAAKLSFKSLSTGRKKNLEKVDRVRGGAYYDAEVSGHTNDVPYALFVYFGTDTHVCTHRDDDIPTCQAPRNFIGRPERKARTFI
jgi:hypothetical protein